MRFSPQTVAPMLVLSLVLPALHAQQAYPNGDYRGYDNRNTRPPSSQFLTADERLAILGTALDFRRRTKAAFDCSHFIHALYERAGFPYEYANSSDIYAGIDEFQRISYPQPGDLIVWRGHAGIVTSASQHTFFSLLSSGPAVNHYDSHYWKQRGTPRFFRYVKTSLNARSNDLRSPGDY